MKKNRRIKKQDVFRRGKKAGLPPGTPVFVGEKKQEVIGISIMNYSTEEIEEIQNATFDDCLIAHDSSNIVWINVDGIHDVNATQALAKLFGLHPLTTEDISNSNQRPKAEEFDDYLFWALKMLTYSGESNTIEDENVSIILTRNHVITFQERQSDLLNPIRERIRLSKGKIRGKGADYLAYAIMDGVVDGYFVALEQFGDYIEQLDDEILTAPAKTHMQELHRLKREIVFLRKAVWPLREEVSAIEKSSSRLIDAAIRPFLRDLYDHTIQIIDIVETYRDIIGGMHDTFLSGMGNRMNQIMKVLTIIGTIFIPLTFIVGVYGMNFDNMPELKLKWGYFGLWGIMAALGLAMLAIFKKRKWLS
jgi:magnesium transporter